MNKVTTCCKATYTQVETNSAYKYAYMCNKCYTECTLEDTPAHTEGLEDRFDAYMKTGDMRVNYGKVFEFIKSELELIVDKIQDILIHPDESPESVQKRIINIIKSK